MGKRNYTHVQALLPEIKARACLKKGGDCAKATK